MNGESLNNYKRFIPGKDIRRVSGVAEASYALRQESAMQWTIPLMTSDYTNFLSEEQLNEKVLTEKCQSPVFGATVGTEEIGAALTLDMTV